MQRLQGVVGVLLRALLCVAGRWIAVPVVESGERHLFLATSERFRALEGGDGDGSNGVRWEGEVARGTTGALGSGVYSVGWDGESASAGVEKLLAGYREEGMVEAIQKHVEGEFKRIGEMNAAKKL